MTPCDGHVYGETVESAVGVVINTPPSPPTFVTIFPHNPQVEDNLYVVASGAVDADGDPIKYHTRWFKNSIEMFAYRNKFMIPYTEVFEGDVFSVEVRAFDGFEESG